MNFPKFGLKRPILGKGPKISKMVQILANLGVYRVKMGLKLFLATKNTLKLL